MLTFTSDIVRETIYLYIEEVDTTNIDQPQLLKKIRLSLIKSLQEDTSFINTIIQIFDIKGTIIYSSKNIPSILILNEKSIYDVTNNNLSYENINLFSSPDNSIILRTLSTKLIDTDNRLIGILRIGYSLKTLKISLNNLKMILIITLPIVILFILLIGFYISKIALLPVKNIVDTFNKISDNNTITTLDIKDKRSEIKLLATTFNEMIIRLHNLFNSQKHLIEDLSHEIKTPLSIIKGQNEVFLKRERTPSEYQDLLLSNLEEVDRLIRLVDNLLMISSFNSKTVELNIIDINLNKLLSDIIDDLKIITEEKEINFYFNNPNIDLYLKGDLVFLKSMFINILDNAIKNTQDNGQIEINLTRLNNFVIIQIKDNGKGIPEEEIPYIFDRYYRAIKSVKIKGFGIGLYIVKSIVSLHNGKIEVKSKLNEGTMFTIYLPTTT